MCWLPFPSGPAALGECSGVAREPRWFLVPVLVGFKEFSVLMAAGDPMG
jgi:hypothetical protein